MTPQDLPGRRPAGTGGHDVFLLFQTEDLTAETRTEIEHLESIATSLDIALTEDDLVQIKEELIEYGYIRRKRTDKKAKSKSKPFHYRSSDGYDIYVGKNNYQNEELNV